jgi:RNA polymerase primary sigma factor
MSSALKMSMRVSLLRKGRRPVLKIVAVHREHTSSAPDTSLREENGTRRPYANGRSGDQGLQIYLAQMSRIPRLSPEQEVATTRKIQCLRAKLRHAILANDFVLERSARLFSLARQGSLRLDRLAEISFSDMDRKKEVMTRMEPNLATLSSLLRKNREDFLISVNRSIDPDQRRTAWRRLKARRDRAVRLVEELDPRIDCLYPPLRELMAVRDRMRAIRQQLGRDGGRSGGADPSALLLELRQLMLATGESLATLTRRMERTSALQRQHDAARSVLVAANLRLVVCIAKHYRNVSMPLIDLIQEGNAGLMRAADKFDPNLGHKFSTYATWWVRQAIGRAIADKSRTIRLPVHQVEKLKRIRQAVQGLRQQQEREPSLQDVAEDVGISPAHACCLMAADQPHVSLAHEAPDTTHRLADQLEDWRATDPAENASLQSLRHQLRESLGVLSDRERRVIELRFGFGDGHARTLEETGRILGLSRERIRQIEKNSLARLKQSDQIMPLKRLFE